MQVISNRVRAAAESFASIEQFYFQSRYAERRSAPGISDFTFGNPHERPLNGLVEAIRTRAVPHNKDWYAYKTSEPEPQAFLAEHVGQELSLPFEPADIALTTGGFAALSVVIRLLTTSATKPFSLSQDGFATSRCCAPQTWFPERWNFGPDHSVSILTQSRRRSRLAPVSSS